MQYRIADANSYVVLDTLPSEAYVASYLLSTGRYQTSRVVLNGIIYVLSLVSPISLPYVIPGQAG